MASPEFTSVRQDVADMLRAGLGEGWIVYPFPKALSNLNARIGVVVVNQKKVDAAGSGLRLNTLEVHVIEPTIDTAAAEDALETRLDAVLDALDTSDLESAFRGAERAMYPVGDSAAHSYVINLEVLTRK